MSGAGTGVWRKWWDNVPLVALGVFGLQPLFYAAALAWSQYSRVGLITAGFAYLLWRHRGTEAGAGGALPVPALLLALGYIFVVNQFDSVAIRGELDAGGLPPTWVPAALIAGALVTCGWRGFVATWHGLDWVAIGLGLLLTSVSVGGALIAGKGFAWHALGRILASVGLWFAVRGATRESPAGSRKLAMGLLAVLLLVCVTGCARAGAVFYYARKGQEARRESALPAAADHYARALALSRELQLRDTAEGMAFRLAGVLSAQGKEDEAAEILAMDEAFAIRVPADGWDGPIGGNLYCNLSCWKDLDLLPGEAEIRIHAQGTPALGAWPQMRVVLGDVDLGYVSVESREPVAHVFWVRVKERERQRLQLSFVNDYHQADPYVDRNLKIGEAEIWFRNIEWE